MLLEPWPLPVNIVVLAAMSVVIALAGWRLARLADMLADGAGLGEAVTGALLLGASTTAWYHRHRRHSDPSSSPSACS